MKIQRHGLRHNQKYGDYVADTKSDSDWVYLIYQGRRFARQGKYPSGRYFRQGTNPDYTGRNGYRLEYFSNGLWNTYDDRASSGDIRYRLECLAASSGILKA